MKLVHRSGFEDDRPYEREFAGIRRYEPVSRSHPNLVTILHVGCDAAGGFFYYVMELADPVAGGVGVEDARYEPRTLRADLQRRGRIEAAECVRIGQGLAGALAYLHGQGLVHRDVKPSNVIFVNGVPQLADIGLVAGWDEARSLVGTEGYIPPEGPGSAGADVFALGRLLYEISTGKDRYEYPEPPTTIGLFPDRELLLGLNVIIRAACDPDPARRYGTAEAMRLDLEALASGRVPRGARGRRIGRRVRAAGWVVAGLGILAGVWGWRSDFGRAPGPPADERVTALVEAARKVSPTTKEGFSEVLSMCHQALEIDARYAPAHAVLANAYRESAGWNRAERDAMVEARRAARRAIELDPNLVMARTQLGLILMLSDWDFAGAEAQFRRGLELDPGDRANLTDYANCLRSLGRMAEARRLVEAALAREPAGNPRSQVVRIEHALLLYSERRFEEMLEVVATIRSGNPDLIMSDIYDCLGWAGLGQFEKALAAVERAQARDDGPDLIALAGYCLGRLGRTEEAQRALARLDGFAPVISVSPYFHAYVRAGRGDADGVVAELNRAIDVRSGAVVGYAWSGLIPDAIWDPFRTDPRWPALLRRVGLPETSPVPAGDTAARAALILRGRSEQVQCRGDPGSSRAGIGRGPEKGRAVPR